MRKLVTLIVTIAVMLASTLPANAAAIDKLLKLPEQEIDIGIAALTFAKEFYPNLDVAAYSRKIDLIADKARLLANGTQDPEKRIRVLNTVLFRQEGFHYDRDPFSRSRQDYYFLNGILDTKHGICYTMPLLYMAVAQRLGYPVYAVAAPDHMFVRYVDASFKEQNIETSSGGQYLPDEFYIEDFAVSPLSLKSGSYLKTLSYREFLGHLLAANAFIYARNGDGGKSIQYLEKAIKFEPSFADHYDNLARGYMAASAVATDGQATIYREKAMQYAAKAKALGFVDPEEIYIRRKAKKQ